MLLMFLSFLGWALETVYMRIATGKWVDRGFMTMPFCPIYGCSVILVYFLIGTPTEGGLFLKKVGKGILRCLLYLLFAALIPTALELLVGIFFNEVAHVSLWDYSSKFCNYRGYVCLRNTLIWAALIFLFMQFLFSPLKRLVGKLPKILARVLALLLLVAVVFDVSLSFAKSSAEEKERGHVCVEQHSTAPNESFLPF